jgi:hypothetical protein
LSRQGVVEDGANAHEVSRRATICEGQWVPIDEEADDEGRRNVFTRLSWDWGWRHQVE